MPAADRIEIDVPTFDGVHLGPMSQLRKDTSGECGCFYYWAGRVEFQIKRAEGEEAAREFRARADRELTKGCGEARVYRSIVTSSYANDTRRLRSIAYRALRAAWRAMGYR